MHKSIEKIFADAGLEITDELLLILKGEDAILRIPNKIQHNMDKWFPRKDLKEIHEDEDTAKELILFLLSNLSSTFLKSQMSEIEAVKNGFKRLDSRILQKQVQYDGKITSPYRKVLDYLIKNGVLEIGKLGSQKSKKATEYRLRRKYFGKGIVPYQIKSLTVRRMRVKSFNANFERVITTNIGKNSLKVRSKMFFPSSEEVREHLEKAVVNKYINKKGKRLVKLGKHSKKEYPESNFVYLEDYLARYEYLRDHMTVPFVSEDVTDTRIIDCFNMMPSLIRKILKINRMPIVETDFSALHPNIIQMFYGGENKEGITHQIVADELGLGVREVKVMHLSFFNMEIKHLVYSPLYDYYMKKEPLMMARVLEDKRISKRGHKVTSDELFKVETNMMEEIVGELNSKGIDVLYVFDAIYSTEQDKSDVVEVMSKIALKYKVRTKAV